MTTEQQDILCETTNLILLSPYPRLPQDQKVHPEKVIFLPDELFLFWTWVHNGKEDAMDFYTHLKNLLTT